MPKNLPLHSLYNSIDFKNDKPVISVFENVFTHISFYEEKGLLKEVGNSRLVFIGMYAFKGILATLVAKYIPGNGKQLQQYLGNAFTNDRLAQIYDEQHFEKFAKASANFEITKHKHIFTLAYLGFLVQYAENEYVEKQTVHLFLKDIQLNTAKKGVNILQILKVKAEQIFNSKIKILNSCQVEGVDTIFTTNISLANGEIIGEHTSVSKLYAKNKAVKLSLKFILEKEAESPIYKNIQTRIQAEESCKKNTLKKQIAIKHQLFLQEKAEKRKLEVESKRKAAKEREYNRLLNKKNLKLGEKPAKKSKEIDTSKLSANKGAKIN